MWTAATVDGGRRRVTFRKLPRFSSIASGGRRREGTAGKAPGDPFSTQALAMSHSHEHMSNGCEASGCEHDHHNCEDHGHEHGHDKKQQSTLPAAVETPLYNLRANACLDKDDFMGAAREAYQGLEVLPDVANLLVAKGRALLAPLLDKVMNDREWNAASLKRYGRPSVSRT